MTPGRRYLLRGYSSRHGAAAPAFRSPLPGHCGDDRATHSPLRAWARRASTAAGCCRFPFLRVVECLPA
nr:MAG TPA: hypothetical protein [Caudoviricetes sp.]